MPPEEETFVPLEETVSSQPEIDIPDLVQPDPLITTESIAEAAIKGSSSSAVTPPPMATSPMAMDGPPPSLPVATSAPDISVPDTSVPNAANSPTAANPRGGATQIQIQQARLLHVQTNTTLEFPPQLPLIHVGKPNDRVPPNIDVSGFPSSEIVSRVHADIRVEGDAYYIEDVGSSNGTYINNMPLAPGNRHRLRPGDKVALGREIKLPLFSS